MKSMRLFVLMFVVLIFSSTVSLANNDDRTLKAKAAAKAYAELKTELVDFMQNPKLKEHQITEETVFVSFKINDEKEIEVIEVLTESNYLKDFVKQNLKDQKLETQNLVRNETYNIKFSFVLQ